jgi:hypothetical protein
VLTPSPRKGTTAWSGRRTRHTAKAEASRQITVTPKHQYGPTTADITPPSDAPTTSIVPHAEPDRALAVARSSGGTVFGSAADAAGE